MIAMFLLRGELAVSPALPVELEWLPQEQLGIRVLRCQAVSCPEPGTVVDGASILVAPDHVLAPLLDGVRKLIGPFTVGRDATVTVRVDFEFGFRSGDHPSFFVDL